MGSALRVYSRVMVSRSKARKSADIRWRVFYIQHTPARELGSIETPDDIELARAKAIETFRIGPERQNKIMVVRAG